jgi:hypothetical protein
MFGFSTTFELAIASRLMIGAFNGVVGTAKTVATELVSDEHQSAGLESANAPSVCFF